MPYTKNPTISPGPDDPPAMVDAINTLNELGIGFDRLTHWQLKIDEWNFYPERGTITCDGAEGAEPERGLDAFLARLGFDRRRLLPADGAPKSLNHDPTPEVLDLTDLSNPCSPKRR